jgi:cold shock CspA family protein
MRYGNVKWFAPKDRGSNYGFITPDDDIDGGRDVFCHRSALHGLELREGDRVKFTTTEDARNHKIKVDTISLCDPGE